MSSCSLKHKLVLEMFSHFEDPTCLKIILVETEDKLKVISYDTLGEDQLFIAFSESYVYHVLIINKHVEVISAPRNPQVLLTEDMETCDLAVELIGDI